MSSSRFFRTPPFCYVSHLPPQYSREIEETIFFCAEKCWLHYQGKNLPTHDDINDNATIGGIASIMSEDENDRKTCKNFGTIYSGGLGSVGFLRLKMAIYCIARSKALSNEEESNKNKAERYRLTGEGFLRDGLLACESSLKSNKNSKEEPSKQIYSLLEGPIIGALVLQSAILQKMKRTDEALNTANKVLDLLADANSKYLKPEDCELLYGRAGCLQAILFLRYYLNVPNFGKEVAVSIIHNILIEGEKGSKESKFNNNDGSFFPFMWSWAQSEYFFPVEYFGSAHGLCGILFTLLHFTSEVQQLQTSEEKAHEHWKDRNLLDDIKKCIDLLSSPKYCFPSGNLKSSTESNKITKTKKVGEIDRLVQWCHGAPGHVFLLIKASHVYQDNTYLEQAQSICRKVIFERGVLKKGLGLCHGIGGNAYCFLSIYRTLCAATSNIDNNDVNKSTTSCTAKNEAPSDCNEGDDTNTSTKEDLGWLDQARHFAQFGIDHIKDLEPGPDHPYSLFEGLGGWASFLIDLQNPSLSNFPCYEYY